MNQNQYDVAIRVKGNVSPQDSEKFTKAVAELAKNMGLESGLEIEPINDDAEKAYSKVIINLWRKGVGAKIIAFHHVTNFKQQGDKIEFYYLRRRKSSGDLVNTPISCYGECLLKAGDGIVISKGKRSEGMSAKALGI
jgi:hypothetical protein